MAKRNRANTDASIQKKIEEGRGRGELGEYKPWLEIQNVPSMGTSTRIVGWKTGRIHQLLSRGEYYFFLWLEWLLHVFDIREQFPLRQELTMEIARKSGIKHPYDPKTQKPIVMTTDFYITTKHGEDKRFLARTFKNTSDLKKTRTCEKLEIERLFWEIKGVDWGIVTERELPMTLIKNVERIHDCFSLDGHNLSEDDVQAITRGLTERIQQRDAALRHITTACDKQLGLEPGKSLAMVFHLIASRQLIIDMNQPLDPSKPLALIDSEPTQNA